MLSVFFCYFGRSRYDKIFFEEELQALYKGSAGRCKKKQKAGIYDVSGKDKRRAVLLD